MRLDRSGQKIFFWGLALLSFFIFAPAFFATFGFHSDYSLLLNKNQKWPLFYQWDIFIQSGRCLGAVLATLESWTVRQISDFAVIRFICFVISLLITFYLTRYFEKDLNIGSFWATVLSFSFVFLPSNQLNIVWALTLPLGVITVGLALASYLILQKLFRQPPMRKTVLAGGILISALLFLMALFIYPINALFVFAVSFAKLLFSPLQDWPKTKREIWREIFFYGLCMGIYFLLNWFFVTQPGVQQGVAFTVAQGVVYKVSLVKNLLAKWPLLKEIFFISASGPWHIIFGIKAAWPVIIAAAAVGVLIFGRYQRYHRETGPAGAFKWVEIFLTTCILFLLANAPCLLAEKCFSVVGYRVLFPASALLLVLQFGLLQKLELFWKNKNFVQRMVKATALLMLGASALIAQYNVVNVVRNFTRELDFIRGKAAFAHPRIEQFIVISLHPDLTSTLIDRKLSYEFTYMLTSSEHFQPILTEILKNSPNRKSIKYIFVFPKPGEIVFLDNETELIDLNELRVSDLNSPYYREKSYITIPDLLNVKTKIIPINLRGGAAFRFTQTREGKMFSYWQMKQSEGLAWFRIDFLDTSHKVNGFKLKGLKGYLMNLVSPAEARMEGSNDGDRWTALVTQLNKKPSDEIGARLFDVKNPQSFKKYRFSFPIETAASDVKIESIQLLIEEYPK